MSSVHLLSAAPTGQLQGKAGLDLAQMRDSAHVDRFGVHRLTDDPAVADIILFVETSRAAGHYFESVRSHPVYREFRSKCYLFSATDKVIPFLPGVFASIERRWYWTAWTRSGYYPGVRERGAFRYEENGPPAYLFSFVGAGRTHSVRRGILGLKHSDALLIDSSEDSADGQPDTRATTSEEEYNVRYVDSIRNSAFVICPRGGGTATFRLFEAMMLGRVPVIVSDQWVPPEGPDWDGFALRIAEHEVDSIPALLESCAGKAPAMGEAARQVWIDWFSEGVAFHRTVEWCEDLQPFAPARAGLRRYMPHFQMLRPYHAARAAAKRLGHGGGQQV